MDFVSFLIDYLVHSSSESPSLEYPPRSPPRSGLPLPPTPGCTSDPTLSQGTAASCFLRDSGEESGGGEDWLKLLLAPSGI